MPLYVRVCITAVPLRYDASHSRQIREEKTQGTRIKGKKKKKKKLEARFIRDGHASAYLILPGRLNTGML